MQLLDVQGDLYRSSKDHLAAVVAFYKWRHVKLRAQYRKRVQDVLEEVSEEDQAFQELKQRFADLNNKWVVDWWTRIPHTCMQVPCTVQFDLHACDAMLRHALCSVRLHACTACGATPAWFHPPGTWSLSRAAPKRRWSSAPCSFSWSRQRLRRRICCSLGEGQRQQPGKDY